MFWNLLVFPQWTSQREKKAHISMVVIGCLFPPQTNLTPVKTPALCRIITSQSLSHSTLRSLSSTLHRRFSCGGQMACKHDVLRGTACTYTWSQFNTEQYMVGKHQTVPLTRTCTCSCDWIRGVVTLCSERGAVHTKLSWAVPEGRLTYL